MFAIIETNGATHIAIHIPKDSAATSLPALAAMLEHNAVFVRAGWSEMDTVKPVMSITLGDSFTVKGGNDQELQIAPSGHALDDGFQIATPEVLASNRAAIKKRDDDLARLREELSFTKRKLSDAEARIATLEEAEEA